MKNLIRQHGRSFAYLMLTDWLILVGTFGVALRFRRYAPGMNLISPTHIATEILFVLFYALLLSGLFSTLKLYKRRTVLSPASHFVRILQGVALSTFGYLLLKVLIKSPVLVPSRLVILNWGLLQLTALIIHRMILFPALVQAASKAQMQRRVVLIGTTEDSIRFSMQLLDQQRFATLRPIGFICNSWQKDAPVTGGLTCLGRVSNLPELVEPHKIEGAIITPTDLSYQDLMDLIECCIRLFGWVDVHTDQSACWHKNLNSDTYFDIPFVRMREISNSPILRFYKAATDRLGAALGLLLLSPLLLLTALAVKLTSPGPVFYTRERVGKNGKLFPFYKFRSMTVGADQDQRRLNEIKKHIEGSADGPQHKIINTACVTPVGKFIRKWAIDELPQLLNVLKGDMSLIGPRPVPPGEHGLEDEWHKKRFQIKPGCTGLWKVYAAKTGVSFNETVLYDLYYARNMSPLLDLYILFMTVWVILTGKADG